MRKILIVFLIIFIVSLFIFLKSGNNNFSQDVVSNIFNMKEYEAEIEVNVISNKSENKYIMKQSYNKEKNEIKQEIIEPENLKGIKITKNENTVILENTELNLSKIFENYNPITLNDMDLQVFVENFKDNNGSIKEENEQFICEAFSKNDNKYNKNKMLYINKNTGIPTKMEIKDINKNTTVYILYNKVEIK